MWGRCYTKASVFSALQAIYDVQALEECDIDDDSDAMWLMRNLLPAHGRQMLRYVHVSLVHFLLTIKRNDS